MVAHTHHIGLELAEELARLPGLAPGLGEESFYLLRSGS